MPRLGVLNYDDGSLIFRTPSHTYTHTPRVLNLQSGFFFATILRRLVLIKHGMVIDCNRNSNLNLAGIGLLFVVVVVVVKYGCIERRQKNTVTLCESQS